MFTCVNLLATLALLGCTTTAVKLPKELADRMLFLHNTYRQLEDATNMRHLLYNEALAQQADKLTRNCNMENPIEVFGTEKAKVGFNFNLRYSRRIEEMDLINGAFQLWFETYRVVDENGGEDSGDYAPYYEIVHADTTAIGCAMNTRCYESVSFVVCYYQNGGFNEEIKPFETGESCTKCPAGTSCGGEEDIDRTRLCYAKETNEVALNSDKTAAPSPSKDGGGSKKLPKSPPKFKKKIAIDVPNPPPVTTSDSEVAIDGPLLQSPPQRSDSEVDIFVPKPPSRPAATKKEGKKGPKAPSGSKKGGNNSPKSPAASSKVAGAKKSSKKKAKKT